MHCHDAMLHTPKQFERVFAGKNGVARIVIDAKARRLYTIDQFAEDVHLLGELGVLPVIVLVMIFDNERDASLLSMGNAGFNTLSGILNPILSAHLRPALPR